MIAARRCTALLAAASALALTGCFGGLSSKIEPPQRYALQVQLTTVTAAAGSASASLKVRVAQAAPGLAGVGIAVLRSGSRLDFYSKARWAAAAPEALQSLVIDALRAGGRFATVEPDTGPFAAQYLLSLDLRHFEAQYDGPGPPTVLVELFGTLGRRSDRAVLVNLTARSAVRADADRMQAVIAAFERATSQALQQLVQNAVPPPLP